MTTSRPPHAAAPDRGHWLLQATEVVKSFGQTVALCSGSLTLEPGEIVAVTGPSGSGKSTLLHCLAGILVPDSGTIEFDGRRLDSMSDDERSALRRSEFGFVFQFGQLVAELTAVENVALPLLLGKTRRQVAFATAGDWLEQLGLGGLGQRRPGELSGGQAQRVALARAMVGNPRIIFADEPTGSLDSAAGTTVLNALTGAARSRKVAVVMVTHDSTVAGHADRAVVVADGVVKAADSAPDGLQ